MSFWSTSTGENLASQTAEQRQEYTPAENNMEPIPAGSKVRAFIKEAKWDKTQDGDRFVKLRWDVVKPDEVARRVIFHKLWVKDSDPNAKNPGDKRDKALRMLAKIDALAQQDAKRGGTLDPATLKRIREEIYGIVDQPREVA